jgi:hypothetical protein
MPGASYYKGQLVRVSATYTDKTTGAAVDPAGVTFKYKNPAGSTTILVYPTDPTLVKDSVGNYHVDINANAIGNWYFQWSSTGVNQAAYEDSFVVKDSQF